MFIIAHTPQVRLYASIWGGYDEEIRISKPWMVKSACQNSLMNMLPYYLK